MVEMNQVGLGPVRYFVDIALGDPLSAILLVIGAILIVVPSAILGVLAVLGIIDWLVPEPASPPPQRG